MFPDQLACAENLGGEREIPDHPLVRQTLYDCLHEAMDIDGLIALLRAIEAGEVERAHARPAAALGAGAGDPARAALCLSGRRAARRAAHPGRGGPRAGSIRKTAAQFGQLDAAAIAAVRSEAWPTAETADELHDALMLLGLLDPERDAGGGSRAALFAVLVRERRATELARRAATLLGGRGAAADDPGAVCAAAVMVAGARGAARTMPRRHWEPAEALRELLRGRLQAIGPTQRRRAGGHCWHCRRRDRPRAARSSRPKAS